MSALPAQLPTRASGTTPAAGLAAVIRAQWDLTVRHGGLLHAALAGAADFTQERRYPARDVLDLRHGTRFFFHAHAGAFEQRAELGHFHVFLDPSGAGAPAATHLIAIAVDALGLPARLFTVNHWVTGGHWQDSDVLTTACPGFTCRTSGRLAPVARWVQACLRDFAPEVQELLRERDARIAALTATGKTRNTVFEDRTVEVLAERLIALAPQHHCGQIDEENET